MDHRGNFEESLRLAHEKEDIGLWYVRKSYPDAVIREGYYKGHDIYIPSIDKSVEVKLDMVASQSGFWGVEIYCNGNPSGIKTTTANKWFFFHGGEIWPNFLSITVSKLKQLCIRFKDDQRDVWLDKSARIIRIPCLELYQEAKIISYLGYNK